MADRRRSLTGNQLLDLWGIDEWELFECLKSGLAAYTVSGKRLVDADELEWDYPPIEELRRRHPFPEERLGYTEEERRDQLAMHDERLQNEYGKVPIAPEGCHAASFAMPDDEDEAEKAVERLWNWRFHLEDVQKYIAEHPKANFPPIRPDINDDDVDKTGLPANVLALVSKARPELELYWNRVKQGVDEGLYDDKKQTESWRNEAKIQFDEGKWQYLRKDYITERDVFQTVPSDQGKRDAIGKILSKIVEQNGLGSYGSQKLYRAAKAARKRQR